MLYSIAHGDDDDIYTMGVQWLLPKKRESNKKNQIVKFLRTSFINNAGDYQIFLKTISSKGGILTLAQNIIPAFESLHTIYKQLKVNLLKISKRDCQVIRDFSPYES